MFFQVWYHKADRDGKPVTIPAVGVLCFVDVEGLFRREENHCRIGIVISLRPQQQQSSMSFSINSIV